MASFVKLYKICIIKISSNTGKYKDPVMSTLLLLIHKVMKKKTLHFALLFNKYDHCEENCNN